MKTGDLAKMFGVSNTAIQTWSTRYEEFLSPKKGIHRRYDENDLITLATVAKLVSENVNHDEIYQRIKAGERVESPSEANFGVDTRMIPAAAVEQLVDSTGLRVELEQLRSERDKLADMLEHTQQSMKELQAKYETQMERLNSQIAELQYKLGRAEALSETYKEQLDEKRRD